MASKWQPIEELTPEHGVVLLVHKYNTVGTSTKAKGIAMTGWKTPKGHIGGVWGDTALKAPYNITPPTSKRLSGTN